MKKLATLLITGFTGLSLNAQVKVTYQVDITDYLAGGATLSPNGIRIGGNFATNGAINPDWTPSDPANALTDGGNNIWSITIEYPSTSAGSTQLYKFVNGDWGTNEGTDPANTIATGGCGVDDGGGNINRTLLIPSADLTLCYKWDGCDPCVAGLDANSVTNLSVSPNPATEVVSFKFDLNGATNAKIQLFDISGKEVSSALSSGSFDLNVSGLESGSYIYRISTESSFKTGKIIKK
jgi:hypothetical protein